MGQIIEFFKLLLQLMPFLMDLIRMLKGQPSEVRDEALTKGLKSMKKHCDGIGCPTDLKRS